LGYEENIDVRGYSNICNKENTYKFRATQSLATILLFDYACASELGFLAANPEVPSSIPGATRFSE
jgi:hypothetical protein